MRGQCTMVVAAGGSGLRFGGDKLAEPLAGRPLLWHTLHALDAAPSVTAMVVAARADAVDWVRALCLPLATPVTVVPGGASRLESVLAGVDAVEAGCPFIGVHDAARPLVSAELIAAVLAAAEESGAAIPALPVTDTIKTASDGFVTATPDRAALFAVQTPQIFAAPLLRRALRAAWDNALPVTDDASAVEALGHPVRLVPGERVNTKITTRVDLLYATLFLSGRDTT